jgi:hypothetical protein
MSKNDEPVDLDLTLMAQTDKAILVTDGKLEQWLPLSLIEWEPRSAVDPREVTVTLPQWLAEERGFA